MGTLLLPSLTLTLIMYVNLLVYVGKRNEGMLLNPPLTAQVPIHEFFLPNRFNQQLPPTRGSAPHSVTQVLLIVETDLHVNVRFIAF